MLHKLKPLHIGDIEVKIPIIQGGMGAIISTASLASSVANCSAAGTIASVGLGYGRKENITDFVRASAESLGREIAKAKELSTGVMGVNILVALSNYESLVKTAVKEGADFIVSGAGLPLNLPQLTEGSPIKLLPIVSSERAADLIIRTWKRRYDRLPDAIVVEGPMAGGHLGFKSSDLKSDSAANLESLLAGVLELAHKYEKLYKQPIPVIVAGGVFTGKDIVKFLGLGAQGVQMATRFVATFECAASDQFKELYLKAEKEDIVIIDSPVGMPGRAMRTDLIERVLGGEKVPIKCSYQCLKTCNPKEAPYCIAEALYNAVKGDVDNAVVFAGSNAVYVDKIASVKDVIEEIVAEAEAELNCSGNLQTRT